MFYLQLRVWSCLALLFAVDALYAKEPIKVICYTYYQYPPFVTDISNQKGLSYEFIQLLNYHPLNADRFDFSLVYQPRKRLNESLKRDAQIVLWVNPLFFSDRNKQLYHWTGTLLVDQQDFISKKSRPFDYAGVSSLANKRLGGVLGHTYIHIQAAIDKGLIKREDVLNEEANIGKLLLDRIDTFLIPQSAMRYYEDLMKIHDRIHYSATPLNRYSRHILIRRDADSGVIDYMNSIVDGLNNNEYWRALLNKYRLDLVPSSQELLP